MALLMERWDMAIMMEKWDMAILLERGNGSPLGRRDTSIMIETG